MFPTLWFRLVCDYNVQEIERRLAHGTLTIDDLWEKCVAKSQSGDIVGRRG